MKDAFQNESQPSSSESISNQIHQIRGACPEIGRALSVSGNAVKLGLERGDPFYQIAAKEYLALHRAFKSFCHELKAKKSQPFPKPLTKGS